MPEPIDNSIALKAQTPNPMNTIGGIMNFAKGAQELQAGRQTIERGGLALKQETMDLQERNALRALSGRLGEFKTESGDPDYAKLIEAATTAAPKHGMKFVQDLAASHVQSVAANSALNKLNDEQRGQIGQVVTSVADLPFADQEKAINSVVEGNPQLKPWGEIALKRLKAAGDDPNVRKQTALKIGQATMPVSQQAGVMAPSGYVANNNAQSGLMNTNPFAGPTGVVPGTVVQNQLPLGERNTVSTNPVTQSPQVTKKDAFGNVIGVEQAPTGKGVPQLNPGEPQEIPVRTQERAQVNAAAAQVPTQHFNNQQIIKLAPESFVGTGSGALSKVFSANGLQWVPGDHSGNSQRLAHFMALQSQANSQAMGAGTDAARQISEQATGSTNWTPEAIISTAKVNDALSTGVDLFNRGMEAAIKANGGNVLAKRDFQNAWSQNFDVRAMQLHNAIEAVDKGEIAKIVKEVGGKDSPAARDIVRKAKALEKLSTDGHL